MPQDQKHLVDEINLLSQHQKKKKTTGIQKAQEKKAKWTDSNRALFGQSLLCRKAAKNCHSLSKWPFLLLANGQEVGKTSGEVPGEIRREV